ncbi:MAG TPA: hypothetical protein VFX89_17120 [Gammaproteobacteria bacterium]|nr:hypothetical protein [Gammaproteobacteria bacterium]
MFHTVRDRWFFPVLVFSALAVVVEAGLALAARALRPEEIPVHAAAATPSGDEALDPALIDAFLTE